MGSAEAASRYVRRILEIESRGWGDLVNALSRIEARYGLPRWTLNNLRTGRAKTIDASTYNRIKAAFADQCARQAAQLLHEAEMTKAGEPNVDLTDIENQIRALAARLAAAKSETGRS